MWQVQITHKGTLVANIPCSSEKEALALLDRVECWSDSMAEAGGVITDEF